MKNLLTLIILFVITMIIFPTSRDKQMKKLKTVEYKCVETRFMRCR